MASIQARHGRACALGKPWTPFELPAACTCTPTYYVAFRDEGKLVREKVGRNRRTAERAGTSSPSRSMRAPIRRSQRSPSGTGRRWLDSLERKQSTKTSYESTIAYATEVFGHKTVRRLGPDDVSAFNAKLREVVVAEVVVDGRKETSLSDSSRAKHLRVLNACLSAAVEHRYAGLVPKLSKAERPRPAKKESAYFTDDELPVLFASIEPGVYRTLFEVALKTGMRVGELTALEWGDIDLSVGGDPRPSKRQGDPSQPAQEPRAARCGRHPRHRRAPRRMVGRGRPTRRRDHRLPWRDAAAATSTRRRSCDASSTRP